MDILLTGASGFIGTALVSRLSKNGHRVVPLRRAAARGNEAGPTWNPAAGEIRLEASGPLDAGPDAIQMNIGQADVLQSIPGPRKPALVLRTDVGNLYNATTHKVMFNQLVHWDEPIIGALKSDAACVVCNLLLMPGEPDLHRQTALNAARLRSGLRRELCGVLREVDFVALPTTAITAPKNTDFTRPLKSS